MTEPTGGPTPMSERMQALLSRAVEDQMTEQRQLTNTLGEIRSLLARLPHEVDAAVNAAVRDGGVEGRVDQVAATVAEIERALRVQLPAVPEQVAALQQQVSSLGDRIGALADQSREEGTEQALHDLVQEVTATRTLTDRLANRAEWLAARNDLDELRGALAARIDAVQGEQAAMLSSRMDELAKADTLSGLSWRLDELVGRLNEVGSLHQRLDGLEKLVGDLHGRLEELHAATMGAAEAVSALGRVTPTVEATRAAVEGTAGGVGTLRQDVGALRELLDGEEGLAEEVAALGDEVAALRAVVERPAPEPPAPLDPRQVADAVAVAVRAATAETERRLTEHVDEAVLALAEALLRRRTGMRPVEPPAAPAPPSVRPSPPAVPPAEVPDTAQEAPREPETEPEPAVAEAPAPPVAEAPAPPVAEAPAPQMPAPERVVAPLPPAPEQSSAWSAPAPRASSYDPAGEQEDDDDHDRRRRPWWRPGD